MSVISAAVLPLKQDAIDRAEQEALAIIKSIENELIKANWDINSVAPYPRHTSMGVKEFQSKLSKYKLYSLITEIDADHPEYTCILKRGEPRYVKLSQKGMEYFIKSAKENAAFQYDCFIAKLESKIPDAKDAILEGNHVWGRSYLYITTTNDSKEMWKTQTIINVSKLGKLFNQYPSRKVKHK